MSELPIAILIVVTFLLAGFIWGADFGSKRAHCFDACYPADWTTCTDDFAVCWNDDRIHRIRGRR